MSWTYSQSTGALSLDGRPVATGYAGRGPGKNNPAMENVRETGPLPKGEYIVEAAYTSAGLGPVTMNLTPHPANQMFGRGLFRIHGDSKEHLGQASEGCIVVARSVRDQIAASLDRHLTVTA